MLQARQVLLVRQAHQALLQVLLGRQVLEVQEAPLDRLGRPDLLVLQAHRALLQDLRVRQALVGLQGLLALRERQA